MKYKKIFIFFILFANFITLCMPVEIHAQVTYTLDITKDETFIWEVSELRLHNFKKVFGFEPTYEKGDQMRKKIYDVIEVGSAWTIVVQNWDYKSNWESNGTIIYQRAYKSPGDFEENIFIPTPVNEYLAEADKRHKEFDVQGSTLIRREKNYKVEKEYHDKGVLLSETYYDDDGVILIQVKGLFGIPFTEINYFIGIIVMAITAIIFVMIKKKKFQV